MALFFDELKNTDEKSTWGNCDCKDIASRLVVGRHIFIDL